MVTRQVTLELTAEQSDAIKSVFKQNNWDYIEIRSRKVKERTKKRKYDQAIPLFCPVPSGNGDPDGGDPGHGDDTSDDSGQMRCIHCYMNPCVVVSQRHLGGEVQGPSECNPPIRKSLYKRFWSVINNLGGWNIQSYQNKKRQAAQLQNIVYWKREIMPDCVLTFVRGLYPNPAGQAYMGHKWE